MTGRFAIRFSDGDHVIVRGGEAVDDDDGLVHKNGGVDVMLDRATKLIESFGEAGGPRG